MILLKRFTQVHPKIKMTSARWLGILAHACAQTELQSTEARLSDNRGTCLMYIDAGVCAGKGKT